MYTLVSLCHSCIMLKSFLVLQIIANCLAVSSQGPVPTDFKKDDNESQIQSTGDCPTWHIFDRETKKCICQDLKDVVKCDQKTKTVSILYGYCMTFDNKTKVTQVGYCFYTLFSRFNSSFYTVLPPNPSELNQFMCSPWHREGNLCSQCEETYGLSIANLYTKCVKCSIKEGVGWLLFFLLELVPVTILFVVVILFRISITRPPMNAFVLHSQLSLVVIYVNAHRFQMPFLSGPASQIFIQLRNIILPVLGIWNLGLFNLIEEPTRFCVDSQLNHLQFYFLTCVTSIHVLLLVIITFVLIELHARNCRLIVWLWRPFLKRFIRFTRVWNSRLTVVDTFASFLLLSYFRLVTFSYFIYAFQPAYMMDADMSHRKVLLYDPEVAYFGLDHIPYVVINLVVLLVLVLTPAIVLALYQFQLFQKCLRLFRCKCVSLRVFVDLFQGYYKDGTGGTKDLRFTASLYLFLRLGLLFAYVMCGFTDFVNCDTLIFILIILAALLFIILAQPYKNIMLTKVDSVLLLLLIFTGVLFGSVSQNTDTSVNAIVLSCVLILVSVPQIIFYSFLLYKVSLSIYKGSWCQKILTNCNFHHETSSSEERTLSQIESSILEELSNDRFNSSYQEGSDNSFTTNILY